MVSAPRDENRVPALVAQSTGTTSPVVVEADADGNLHISIEADNAGIGGGTQYTEDVATANPQVGSATMIERDDQLSTVTPVEGDWIGLRGSSEGAMWVAIADGAGDPITSFGGGTQYAVDAVAGAADTGTLALVVRDDATTTLTPADGDYTQLRTNSRGALWVDLETALDATNDSIAVEGKTTGGLSTYYDADLDETAVVVKAAAGTLYAIQAFNTTAAPLFLQLFNVAQGSVTVGTTTPTQQYVIPGNADSDGAGFTFNVPQGKAFGTAITAACSTDSEGNTAPGAGACIINIDYK